MKNKKGLTIYSEAIYHPVEFRVRQPMKLIMWSMNPKHAESKSIAGLVDECVAGFMPCIMTGWVQNEVHIQWGHQSLN